MLLPQAETAGMSPNIVLHHAIPTRSCRVAWLLEELEVPYKLRPVDFPKELWTEEYKKENPTAM
jgi:glutathione S-transferase